MISRDEQEFGVNRVARNVCAGPGSVKPAEPSTDYADLHRHTGQNLCNLRMACSQPPVHSYHPKSSQRIIVRTKAMKRLKLIFPGVMTAFAILTLALSVKSQQPAPQQAASRFDVTHYRIEAQIIPDQHQLRAGADVTFTPLDATRSVVFELNGSLKIESIEKDGKPLTSFVQDAVGVGALGPSVRIDLGQVMPANQPITLRIRWSGALINPEGGPLATRRLAYVGNEGSYLMYASRWFPFHDYAADRATSDITFIVPSGLDKSPEQVTTRW